MLAQHYSWLKKLFPDNLGYVQFGDTCGWEGKLGILPQLLRQDLVCGTARLCTVLSAFLSVPGKMLTVRCVQEILVKWWIDFFWPLEQNSVRHHSSLFQMCGCSETVNKLRKCIPDDTRAIYALPNLVHKSHFTTRLEGYWNRSYSQDNISKCIFPMLNISLSFLSTNMLMVITNKEGLFEYSPWFSDL